MFAQLKRKKMLEQQNRDKAQENQGIFAVQRAEMLLSNERCQNNLKELKGLLCVTKQEFESIYMSSLCRYCEYVQRLPYVKDKHYMIPGGFLDYTLDLVITTLKFRRAFMLPPGQDAETCYREQGNWTLAVFLASLLQNSWMVPVCFEVIVFLPNKFQRTWQSYVGLSMPYDLNYRFYIKESAGEDSGKSFNVMLIKSLLPVECITQLYDADDVFRHWFDHINFAGAENNPITNIVKRAEEYLAAKSNKSDVVLNDVSSIAENKKSTTTSKEIIEQLDSRSEQNNIAKSNPQFDVIKEFTHWISQSLSLAILSINQQNSIIHRVRDGIFIVMPQAFELFVQQVNEAKQCLSGAPKSPFDNFLSCLSVNHENILFNNQKSSYLHNYCDERRGEADILKGVVIKTNIIFTKINQMPKINSQFKPVRNS